MPLFYCGVVAEHQLFRVSM